MEGCFKIITFIYILQPNLAKPSLDDPHFVYITKLTKRRLNGMTILGLFLFFLLEDSTSVAVHGFWIFITLQYLIGFNLTM